MSSVHRILTGLRFISGSDPGQVTWSAETEDLVRLSLELARVTRSGLAFAAVANPPVGELDCGHVDQWLAQAEQELELLTQSASIGHLPIETAVWFGSVGEEWTGAAQDSEMDLLIVPGLSVPGTAVDGLAELQWPERSSCPVWFAGREPDRLDDAPPLIVFCDDLSDEAAVQLPLAVDLAMAWNARLLIVHPLSQPAESLSKDEDDRLRREVFQRLSRTDFRALSQGSQLRLLPGNLEEILTQVSTEQPPNLVLASARLVSGVRPQWRGHLLLWAADGDAQG
jgi:hypothetical protein